MKLIIDLTDEHEVEIAALLNFIGHPEALVTDLSTLRDFFYLDADLTGRCADITEKFRIRVHATDTLVEIAERIRKLPRTRLAKSQRESPPLVDPARDVFEDYEG